jgi:hypothetical protein
MAQRTDFFSQAFSTLARAIAEAGVNVDLYMTPETISKSMNRKVRADVLASMSCHPGKPAGLIRGPVTRLQS